MALSNWQKFALGNRVDTDIDETGDDTEKPGRDAVSSEAIPARVLHRRIPILLIDWISEIELGLRLLDQSRGECFSLPDHLEQAAKRRDCPKSRIRLSPVADDLHNRLIETTGQNSTYILLCALSAAASSPLTKARDQTHPANHNTEPLHRVGHTEGDIIDDLTEQPELRRCSWISKDVENGIRPETLPYFVTSSPTLYPDFETVTPFEALRAFNTCHPDTLLEHMESIHAALQSPDTMPDERILLKAAADQARAAYRA